MPIPVDVPFWFAIRTRSRHEKLVRDRLAAQGLDPFLPTVKKLSHWKDRKKKIEVPLFAGYCFARFSWENRLLVQQIPGVASIVGSGGRPEPVPEAEITALHTLMQSRCPYDPHPYLAEGMVVQIIAGPLAGLTGILVRKDRHHRVVLGVRLIQQAAAVVVDAEQVWPVEASVA